MKPIVLATDYGVTGPYVGQLKSAIYKITPGALIIDMNHDLPVFNPKASAYLLASYSSHIPTNSIVVGVVDPGVGSNRAPIILECGGCTFIGPDNGLFAIVAKKLLRCNASKILLAEEPACRTFHGRDVFAPIAAQMASGSEIQLEPFSCEEMTGAEWPLDLPEIIYNDHFGNAVSGITLDQVDETRTVRVKKHELNYAATFHSVSPGQLFWYRNANGLLEIAAREASAEEKCRLSIGDSIHFK